jgi:mutator protein MutT
MSSTIDVSAGIIVKGNKILAARRRTGLHLAGFWEFPGGRVELNESPENCLVRELKEEFGIDTRVTDYVGDNYHAYGDKIIHLIAFRVEHLGGEIELIDHDEIKWLTIDELDSLRWAEADIPIVQAFKASISLTVFYQKQAISYAKETASFDMGNLYPRFLNHLPNNAHILDLGCGSGRDSNYFLDQGYLVTALDGSAELAGIAEKLIKQPVVISLYQDMVFEKVFDGVWACASLLHCPKSQMSSVLLNIYQALKDDGVLYASFKWGENESSDERGRFFNNYTSENLITLIESIGGFKILACWEEDKSLRNSTQRWVNLITRKVGAVT